MIFHRRDVHATFIGRVGIHETRIYIQSMVRLLITVQKENQPGRLLDPLDKLLGKGTRYKLGSKGFAG